MIEAWDVTMGRDGQFVRRERWRSSALGNTFILISSLTSIAFRSMFVSSQQSKFPHSEQFLVASDDGNTQCVWVVLADTHVPERHKIGNTKDKSPVPG